jgi:N-carbamoylputrescine amidase
LPDLSIALVSQLFIGDGAAERLAAVLRQARAAGAELAILPELPLNAWCPATASAADADAEGPGGPRSSAQAEAAAAAGIALVGGAIVRHPVTGARHNTALVYDAQGLLLGAIEKSHLPEEPGFLETAHSEPGDRPPRVIEGLPMPLGIQICSDANRPQGTHILAALGAELIVVPRATPRSTYPRWRTVFAASALTSGTYLASVNRPGPELGVPIGGPSCVVGPDGEFLAESEDSLQLVRLSASLVRDSRLRYPGYLPVRADLYAEGWRLAAARLKPPAARSPQASEPAELAVSRTFARPAAAGPTPTRPIAGAREP